MGLVGHGSNPDLPFQMARIVPKIDALGFEPASGNFPKRSSMNCCADMGVPSECQKVVLVMCWIVRSLPSASLTFVFCEAAVVQARGPAGQLAQTRG